MIKKSSMMDDGKKAVILLSGGLDSATMLLMMIEKGYRLYPLLIDYGQSNKIELEKAKAIARKFNTEKEKIVKVELDKIGGSIMTEKNPKIDTAQSLIPATYVPARNTIFLSIALGYAETIGTGDIFIAVNAIDYSGYPDCRKEYIEAFEKMANLATRSTVENKVKVKIHTPLIAMSKADIIKQAARLNLDFSMTNSCYFPNEDGNPCHTCDSCKIRAKGFLDANIKDSRKSDI